MMMKKGTILAVIIFACYTLLGQVTFIISSIPDYTPPDDVIYLAGDLNGWNPGNPDFQLEKNSNENWNITLPEEPNTTIILFKFTRGDWSMVEKGASGEEIPDRQFTFGNGDTVYIDILNWADYGGGNSTAAENVSIIDDNFHMPELNRNRRIWIYYPPDYNTETASYPVLYMNDGQNLFDTYTSYAGEWEVDETLNNLAENGHRVPIVVGIDNGGNERIDEYTPWVNLEYGGGNGENYIAFIVNTLKPFIDANYRTLSGRENTGIMGSSLGGLISHYGAIKYQGVFSKAGIFSPSYWFSDSVWAFTTETGKTNNMNLYQLMGGQEGPGAVNDMWEMHDTLYQIGFGESELLSKEVPGGQHNEAFWRSEFAAAYLWMYATYASNISKLNEEVEIIISPNPVSDIINLGDYEVEKSASLIVYSMKGEKALEIKGLNAKHVNVESLPPGSYMLLIHTKDKLLKAMFIKI